MRGQLFKLRSTWDEKIFLKSKLFAIDSKLNEIDKAWVITIARPGGAATAAGGGGANKPFQPTGNVHVNPKFFNKSSKNNDMDVVDDDAPPKATVVEVKTEPLEKELTPPKSITEMKYEPMEKEPSPASQRQSTPPKQEVLFADDKNNIRDPRLRRRPNDPPPNKKAIQQQQQQLLTGIAAGRPTASPQQPRPIRNGGHQKRDGRPSMRNAGGAHKGSPPPSKRFRTVLSLPPHQDHHQHHIQQQPKAAGGHDIKQPTVAPGAHAFEPMKSTVLSTIAPPPQIGGAPIMTFSVTQPLPTLLPQISHSQVPPPILFDASVPPPMLPLPQLGGGGMVVPISAPHSLPMHNIRVCRLFRR
jgi:hypothetical protein